jgi:hypothetical protein
VRAILPFFLIEEMTELSQKIAYSSISSVRLLRAAAGILAVKV